MQDARMFFTALTGDAFSSSKVGSNVLQIDPWTELGNGSPKFLNIMCDGLFATGAEVASVYLLTSTNAAPAAGDEVGALIHDEAMSGKFLTKGLIAKIPLPSLGLVSGYANIYFYAETTVTAGGHLTAYITLD